MPKKRKKNIKKPLQKKNAFFKNRQTQFVLSVFIMLVALLLLFAFISFFKTWQADQSILTEITNPKTNAKNLLGKIGASISNIFLFKGFGIGSFVLPILLFLSGLYILLQVSLKKTRKPWFFGILGMIWMSLFFGFIKLNNPLFAGTVGFELDKFLNSYIGKPGILALLFVSLLSYVVIRFGLTPENISNLFPKKNKDKPQEQKATTKSIIIDDKKEELPLEVYSHKEEIIADQTTATETIKEKKSTEEEVATALQNIVDEEHHTENLSDTLLNATSLI